LVDLKIESCKNIQFAEYARLKIATDITRGYLEDPRLSNFIGYDTEENPKQLELIDLSDDSDAEKVIKKLKIELTKKNSSIEYLNLKIIQNNDSIFNLEKRLQQVEDEAAKENCRNHRTSKKTKKNQPKNISKNKISKYF
jgi:predicted RNase H-like nuclease (RuvC/YqgF family)